MHLGPLQQGDDGLWALGDSAIGAKGGYVKLLPEGAEHWWRGSREVLVPWSRFMSLDGLEVTPRRIGSSRTVGVVNTLGGAGTVGMLGSCLTVTLRHPYEVWVAQFSHHQRRYGWHHLALVEELLRQAIQAGEAERLGDPDRLDWWSSFSSRSVPGPRGA